MSGSPGQPLLCPALNISIELPSDPAADNDDRLRQLPAKPGVYLLQDESHGTLALASTANLRRTIASRLETPPANQSSRRINLRALVRHISATTVGSAFEADWAYLQLARIHLPRTYQSTLDRWQSWFVAIDPSARYPQFVKTAHPGRLPAGDNVVNFGPFADKHAAARYMDLLQDMFDLCRYQHILVQAPHGSACAYKEMGRCPAPCDGSVSMEHYHRQIRQAMNFAGTPIDLWRRHIDQTMHQAAASLDFEFAGRLREQRERSKPAAKPSLSHVRRLEDFRFLAVCRSEKRNWIRLFHIRGGFIEPFSDVRNDVIKSDLQVIVEHMLHQSQPTATEWNDTAVENIGLVCWHLFRPRERAATCELLRLDQDFSASYLARSFRRILRKDSGTADPENPIDEHELDSGLST